MFRVDELGLDLGTSTLHMVVRGKGIVLSEPAYVAYDRQTRIVVAVGEEARRMYGRTPAGLIVERPLRDGLGTTGTFMGWTRVSDPQPGDVVVNSYHTGIYIGGGQMIHASDYNTGVIISSVAAGMNNNYIFVRY